MATRCTEATLNAFGIFGRVPRDGCGVLEALTGSGFGYANVDVSVDPRRFRSPGVTLARFVREHPTGSYYLVTAGHAMALVDGALTDYAEEGPNRRRMLAAWRVERSTCSDSPSGR